MRTFRFLALAPLLVAFSSAPPAAALAESAGAAPGAQTAAIAEPDRETVSRLVDYLNGITSLRARFIQVSSNGAYAEGDVYLHRPGRLRFEYDPPHPALLIANGVTLLYYDRELEQATFLPLWETPLWFLVREEIDLSKGVEVMGVERRTGTIRVTLRSEDSGTEGEVTLIFADRPVALHSWEIHDPQGVVTQVSLVNPRFGVELDPELFEHDDLDVHFKRRNDR